MFGLGLAGRMLILTGSSGESGPFYSFDFRGMTSFTSGTRFTSGAGSDLIRPPWTFTRATARYVEHVDDDGSGNYLTTLKQIPAGMIPLDGFSVRETGFGGFGVADWGYSTVTETSGLTIPTDASRGATDTGTWGRQGYTPGPARTNVIAYSYDATQYTQVGAGNEALDAVGITGAANTASTIEDTDAATPTRWLFSGTIAASATSVLFVYAVKADTDETRFPGLYASLSSGGTPVAGVVHLNTKTGATAIEAGATGNTTVRSVERIGDFWWVAISIDNGGAETLASAWVWPARGTVLGNFNSAATGSIVLGHVEVNNSATFRTSPIITNGSTATQNADALVPTSAAETDTDWTATFSVSSDETVTGKNLTDDDSVQDTLTTVPNGEAIRTLEIVDGA